MVIEMSVELLIGRFQCQTGPDWAKVRQLLAECFDEIERLWEQDPLSTVLAQAVVVKEYMRDHDIPHDELTHGIRCYLEFRAEQQQRLLALGLCQGSLRHRSN